MCHANLSDPGVVDYLHSNNFLHSNNLTTSIQIIYIEIELKILEFMRLILMDERIVIAISPPIEVALHYVCSII